MVTGIGQEHYSFSIILYVTPQKSDCGKSKASRAIADSGWVTGQPEVGTKKNRNCRLVDQQSRIVASPPLRNALPRHS